MSQPASQPASQAGRGGGMHCHYQLHTECSEHSSDVIVYFSPELCTKYFVVLYFFSLYIFPIGRSKNAPFLCTQHLSGCPELSTYVTILRTYKQKLLTKDQRGGQIMTATSWWFTWLASPQSSSSRIPSSFSYSSSPAGLCPLPWLCRLSGSLLAGHMRSSGRLGTRLGNVSSWRAPRCLCWSPSPTIT